MHAAEQEREDVRAAREAWFEAQPELDPDRLVFLDETAAATNMARRYGWAPRGERCRLAAPWGHYKTTTITAALRTCGLCATASTNRYSREDLLPLHARCRCTVSAVTGAWEGPGDPGHAINLSDLSTLYRAAGGTTSGRALKRVKVRIEEHGELGPQLVVASAPRNGPAAAARRADAGVRTGGTGAHKSAPEIKVDAKRVLERAEEKIAELEARAARGQEVSGPLKYQRQLAARMRLELRLILGSPFLLVLLLLGFASVLGALWPVAARTSLPGRPRQCARRGRPRRVHPHVPAPAARGPYR